MGKEWGELSPDERQEKRLEEWLSPEDVEFKSPEAEKAYKERATRLKDVIQLKKLPDRVPIYPVVSFFPAYYAGITPRDMMYDYDKAVMACKKYVLDFEPDAQIGAGLAGAGRIFDILDYRLYAWPGHGVLPEYTYQCVEGEYMRADEYDDLIRNPSHFFSTIYLPRVFGALEPFRNLPNLTWMQELPFIGYCVVPFGDADIQGAYKALFQAGNEAKKWLDIVSNVDEEIKASGFPNIFGGFSKVAFDVIGDTLRGTRGIMLDIYRQPDKLLEAIEAITPIMIDMGVSAAKGSGNPLVFIPLHKGADGFLSDEQFRTFYWPGFKKLLMGLIDEGCVPLPWAEGGYNSRLEVIRDVPRGKVLYGFDTTDMARAKEVLGGVACIGGNVPTALLTMGTPQEIRDYTRKLIDTAGGGGGYVMMNGAALDDVNPENVKIWVDFTKEYGVYK
jgi:hypothetical protein